MSICHDNLAWMSAGGTGQSASGESFEWVPIAYACPEANHNLRASEEPAYHDSRMVDPIHYRSATRPVLK